ncbi:MAG: SCO family protein [Acidobacteria bacterium]|nr:MAG: SCO family protein [Acidobacteriota bacterium]REK04134.1 MAG: SCO family protein [Acidobacteriota bacterium]REK15296.1 MAG: SCO family protein [Acidobacteriota bacterium]REK46386.1 MAG: SCO family protein [Acidobacteriota bacterium]
MRRDSAVLRSVSLKLVLFSLILASFGGAVLAQKSEHYSSPLYSPRKYEPGQTSSNGMPAQLKTVGIDQKLGAQLPLEARFKDENGNEVELGKYFNNEKPVIIALVYYECPMLCNEVLNGLTGSLKGVNFNAGNEFDVVAISFDARENRKADLAKNKKKSYLERYNREGTADGWHFLTGEQAEIDKVTEAVGFNYTFDERTNQFAHAGGIMVATPEGKLSRYLYGIDYSPNDLKFSIMESSENRIGNPAEQLYLYCFHYDPSTGKYGFAILSILRLFAVATLLGLGTMFFVFWRRGKAKKAES